eukprot:7918389-Pyramimonas_sp.AAC.1
MPRSARPAFPGSPAKECHLPTLTAENGVGCKNLQRGRRGRMRRATSKRKRHTDRGAPVITPPPDPGPWLHESCTTQGVKSGRSGVPHYCTPVSCASPLRVPSWVPDQASRRTEPSSWDSRISLSMVTGAMSQILYPPLHTVQPDSQSVVYA